MIRTRHTSLYACRALGPVASLVLAAAWVSSAAAAPATVYGIAANPRNPTDLLQFDEGGALQDQWSLTEAISGISLATNGTHLFVAEFEGAIERYDLQGNYLGQFANVSDQAGFNALIPTLEFDAAGSLYVAFGGFASFPRTSFRLNAAGAVTATYEHVDLVFPNGIDAAANGDVYIVNSAAVGVGERLFKFSAAGAYLADYPLPTIQNASNLAINQLTGELFLADEFDKSIQVFDINGGAPVFKDRLPMPDSPAQVFIEPNTGRIFGTYATFETDAQGFYLRYTGFEISRSGDIVSEFVKTAAPPREQTLRNLVAISVPEPASSALAGLLVAACCLGRRRE